MTLQAEAGPPLASGLETFLDAFDVATAWLDAEDPQRTGERPIAIVETDDGDDEEVWVFPPARQAEAKELVRVFGFDPVAWTPKLPERSATSWTSRLAGAERAPVPALELPRPTEARAKELRRTAPPAPASEPAPARPAAPRPRRERRSPALPSLRLPDPSALADTARAVWADPPSRYLLSVAIVGVWLSTALLDPSFLFLPLVALACLRWRQRRLRAVEPDELF